MVTFNNFFIFFIRKVYDFFGRIWYTIRERQRKIGCLYCMYCQTDRYLPDRRIVTIDDKRRILYIYPAL